MIQLARTSYGLAQRENFDSFRWSINNETGMAMFKARLGTPEWNGWFAYYRSVGRRSMESVARNNLSVDEHGKYYPVPAEWPPVAHQERAA